MFSIGSFLWLLVTTGFSVCRTNSVEYSRFECGLHGKFEYCIDDIPGCVIGCHCHPGYYFDTGSKICEPNIKLTENFKRRYVTEPTRLYPVYTPKIDFYPTPTMPNTFEESLGDLTKDDDDLGDWLYNQFFKTIEAQVINRTNDKTVPTRRREIDSVQPDSESIKIARAGHKSNNSNFKRKSRKSVTKSGKKKSSKDSLRRKLLRITEDDSLFDSDSGDRDSSSDSGSDSNSRSSGETSRERNVNENHTDDREHGHKKVIMFNRRPRPPLPSFIILPSMDAPYYPPIGLPPPPVMPMYPMVPIPPVAPYVPIKEESNTNTTTTITASSSSDTDSTSTEPTTSLSTEATVPPSLRNLKAKLKKPKKAETKKSRKHKLAAESLLIGPNDAGPNLDVENSIHAKEAERRKLVQKLKARLKIKHNVPSVFNDVVEEIDDDMPVLNDDEDIQVSSTLRPKHRTENDKDMKEKDFKYLSELIHRVNFSDPRIIKEQDNINDFKNIENIPNMRRYYNPPPPQQKYRETPNKKSDRMNSDDNYFMNLGRQIASLIRASNSQLDSKERLQKEQKNDANSIINENTHPSGLYWERSVRSPLKQLKNYYNVLNYHKEPGENNLLDLENEVNIYASTVPPMTLQELENSLNRLEKHQPNIKDHATDQSNSVFNINLLPAKALKITSSYRKNVEPNGYADYVPQRRNFENINDTKQEAVFTNATHYLEPTDMESPISNQWILQNDNFMPVTKSNQPPILIQDEKNSTPFTYYPIDMKFVQNKPKLSHEDYLMHSDGIPSAINPYYEVAKKIPEKLKNHMTVKTPVFSENHFLNPKRHHDEKRFEKNSADKHNARNSLKRSRIPFKHPELPIKYNEWPAKDHMLAVKYHELPAKYNDLHAKYEDLRAKYIELSIKYREQPTDPTKDQERLGDHIKYLEIPTKYIELSDNDSLKINKELSEVSVKHPESSSKFADIKAKYQEEPLKYFEIPTNLPEQSRRYSELTANYPPNTRIFDYKKRNLFANNGGLRRYTFETSYPLRIPSYRRTFSKGVESPSYFHHELHHFDYFE